MLLIKVLLRIRDPKTAEALWFKGSLLNDDGRLEEARTCFWFSLRLDPGFGGAFWNYAALTEKLRGPGAEAAAAWRAFIKAAVKDPRQQPSTIEKVKVHLLDLERQTDAGK